MDRAIKYKDDRTVDWTETKPCFCSYGSNKVWGFWGLLCPFLHGISKDLGRVWENCKVFTVNQKKKKKLVHMSVNAWVVSVISCCLPRAFALQVVDFWALWREAMPEALLGTCGRPGTLLWPAASEHHCLPLPSSPGLLILPSAGLKIDAVAAYPCLSWLWSFFGIFFLIWTCVKSRFWLDSQLFLALLYISCSWTPPASFSLRHSFSLDPP